MKSSSLYAACAAMLLMFLTACGGGAGTTSAFVSAPTSLSTVSSLQGAASAKQILYGVATSASILSQDAAFSDHVAQEAAIVVPENELKWDTTEPEPGNFNFAPGDALLSYASAHHMQFRGHTLVWDKQLPVWAGYAPLAQQQMTSHITAEVTHYAGKVQSWDVVNEAIEPMDGRGDGLRNNLWLQAIGPSYVDLAFRTAAAADPNATLVINEYGLEYDNAGNEARRNAMLALLTRLKQSGVPVGALGIQSHLHASQNGQFNSGKFAAFLQKVAALGLKIYITELDVAEDGLPGDVTARDTKIAQAYYDYLSTALKQPAVTMVVTWGLSDKYSWLTQETPRPDGQPVRPLPLDQSMQAKPAWNAMAQAFAETTAR